MADAPEPHVTDDVPDEIVLSIDIAASAENVYKIVAEPGWFLNDGEYRQHEITTEGTISRVKDPVHGTFTIATELREPPHRVHFRWLGGGLGEISDAPTNTVEFVIDPIGRTMADGVRLTVRERGFAGLSRDVELRRRNYEENLQGWKEELEVARTVAERRPEQGLAEREPAERE